MEGVRAVGAALQPWSVAVASVLVASGLARGSSWLGLELAVSWFYVATAVTAWLAGRAPGVFASILATALPSTGDGFILRDAPSSPASRTS